MSLDAMDDRTRGFEEERLAWFIARRIYERASGQDTQEVIFGLNLQKTPRLHLGRQVNSLISWLL
jgi:hypothetical protein